MPGLTDSSTWSGLPPGVLQVLRLSHEGRGVARNAEGKTVFIEGALPGEQVTCKVRFTRSRYDEAVVDQVFLASSQRKEPTCLHYGVCGGCNLQHLKTEGQLAFKQGLVAELLGVPEAQLQAPITAQPLGYRRKARLGVKWRKDGRLLLGFREKNSAYLTSISECPVLQPSLEALLPSLHELLPQLEGGKHIGHIELLQGDEQTCVRVRLLRSLKRLSPRDQTQWRSWAQQQGVQLLWQDDAVLQAAEGDIQPLSYTLEGLKLSFAATDFVQVNPEVNQQMVAQALDWLALEGQERVLDLFCGFGNFTLPLATQVAQVLGVEGLEAQVECARLNAVQNGLEAVEFMAADLSQPLQQQPWYQAGSHWDAVLLDPPRAGAEQICAQLGELGASRVLYVSCNPATLARDKVLLEQQGYRLAKLGILDMFPQTSHVETMALFIKSPLKNPAKS